MYQVWTEELSPTGKKCRLSVASSSDPKDSVISDVSKGKKKQTGKSHLSDDGGLNCKSNPCGSMLYVPVALDMSDYQSSAVSSEASSEEEESYQVSSAVQSQNLKQLQKVNVRLNVMEERVAAGHQQSAELLHKDFFLS